MRVAVTHALAKGQAALLGGLAGGAVLCFGLFFAGVAWLFAAWYFLDEYAPDDMGRYYPLAVFVASSLASLLLASRFGWKVGHDWYHCGR